jgi:predicted nucleotidyltransferase
MNEDEKYIKYVEAWRERVKARKKKEERLAIVAKKIAKECARILCEEFGAKRVYLFGSLTDGTFHESSDIDLAVEGLASNLYFKALVKVYEVSNGFEVDLAPLEEYRYKESILKEGELLYAIKGSETVHSLKG